LCLAHTIIVKTAKPMNGHSREGLKLLTGSRIAIVKYSSTNSSLRL
jgi:hypothetical protein